MGLPRVGIDTLLVRRFTSPGWTRFLSVRIGGVELVIEISIYTSTVGRRHYYLEFRFRLSKCDGGKPSQLTQGG